MRGVLAILALTSWTSLWWTPDQYGQRLMQQERFSEAATEFNDPMRRGVAWYRAGEFEKALTEFSRVASTEASYNRANCLVMLGKYDQAIESYDDALKRRPDWEVAQQNRDLAAARAKQVEAKGGDLGDQTLIVPHKSLASEPLSGVTLCPESRTMVQFLQGSTDGLGG